MAVATFDEKTARRQRVRNIIGWILAILLGFEFLAAGALKFIDNPVMVDMFNRVGLGQWFRYFTGALEIIGGAGILIPRFSRPAALLLAVIMLGAVVAQLTRIHQGAWVPALMLFLALVVARMRRDAAPH
jgi:putative oxidoreductase